MRKICGGFVLFFYEGKKYWFLVSWRFRSSERIYSGGDGWRKVEGDFVWNYGIKVCVMCESESGARVVGSVAGGRARTVVDTNTMPSFR